MGNEERLTTQLNKCSEELRLNTTNSAYWRGQWADAREELKASQRDRDLAVSQSVETRLQLEDLHKVLEDALGDYSIAVADKGEAQAELHQLKLDYASQREKHGVCMYNLRKMVQHHAAVAERAFERYNEMAAANAAQIAMLTTKAEETEQVLSQLTTENQALCEKHHEEIYLERNRRNAERQAAESEVKRCQETSKYLAEQLWDLRSRLHAKEKDLELEVQKGLEFGVEAMEEDCEEECHALGGCRNQERKQVLFLSGVEDSESNGRETESNGAENEHEMMEEDDHLADSVVSLDSGCEGDTESYEALDLLDDDEEYETFETDSDGEGYDF